MYDVHGISVAGGTFPATIWNLFMSKALENQPAQDFLVPYTFPTYHAWSGQWQYKGGSTDQTTTGYAYTPTTTYYQPTTTYSTH